MPNTKQQITDLAKKMARQAAQEPIEILKDARSQVLATPERPSQNEQNAIGQNSSNPTESRANLSEYEQKTKAKDSSLLTALQNETKEIRLQNLLKDLQARISAGEQISLPEYSELSMDQKQVLKSQMEAVRVRNAQARESDNVPQISSKKSRRFGMGRSQKASAEREQVKTEKPMPPSG